MGTAPTCLKKEIAIVELTKNRRAYIGGYNHIHDRLLLSSDAIYKSFRDIVEEKLDENIFDELILVAHTLQLVCSNHEVERKWKPTWIYFSFYGINVHEKVNWTGAYTSPLLFQRYAERREHWAPSSRHTGSYEYNFTQKILRDETTCINSEVDIDIGLSNPTFLSNVQTAKFYYSDYNREFILAAQPARIYRIFVQTNSAET